jgi:hypothetical protein
MMAWATIPKRGMQRWRITRASHGIRVRHSTLKEDPFRAGLSTFWFDGMDQDKMSTSRMSRIWASLVKIRFRLDFLVWDVPSRFEKWQRAMRDIRG